MSCNQKHTYYLFRPIFSQDAKVFYPFHLQWKFPLFCYCSINIKFDILYKLTLLPEVDIFSTLCFVMSCMCLCFRNEMSIQVYQLLKLCHERSVAFETAFIQVTTYHLMGNAFMSFELLRRW